MTTCTGINTFTYNGWEADKAEVEQIRSISSSSVAVQHVNQKLKSMANKQNLHESDDALHPGIARIQVPGAFTYELFAEDLKEVFMQYILGNGSAVDRLIQMIEFKQKLHDEDSSDPPLDSHTCCDPGWKDGQLDVDCAIDASRGDRVDNVVRCQTKCVDINSPHFEVCSHSPFSVVQACRHPLLSTLDFAEFDYPHWEEDRVTIKETLVHSINAFAEYDAMRLYKGMKNKQGIFSGVNLHPGIHTLRTDSFSYEGFKLDKSDAMNEYRAGYDSAFEKRLECIQKKQMRHDCDHSDPDCATNTKKVTFAGDVCVLEGKENGDIHTKDVERWVPDACVVCLSAPRTHIFAPCGHLCLCNTCAFKTPYRKRKRAKKHSCPICRQESTSIVKVYF